MDAKMTDRPTVDVHSLDLSRLVISYDRDSDTLMLHFFGQRVPGVSVPFDDHLLVRMNRDRTMIIGLQIEGFLAHVARERPRLLTVLEAAELRGISRDEVSAIAHAIGAAQVVPPVTLPPSLRETSPRLSAEVARAKLGAVVDEYGLAAA